MEKLDKSAGQSMDIVADNIAKLKELFPEILTENKIDFKTLQALLGEEIEVEDERYSFNWHGKAQARKLAQTPSTGTLRPCPEESVDWNTTQNLFIEGDNLEVLKLLQKSYHKQVKMIYIDPPYNTGSDFVYPDDFQDNIQNYLELTGQVESGKKISTNTESSGRYHTDWLNMMYPRLKLARNLLKDEGVIFISIGDDEQSNLKSLCDDVFGEDNYINTISINMKNIAGASGGGEDKKLKKNIEYLHVYAKSYSSFKPFKNIYDYIPITELVEQYRDDDVSWKYTSVLVNDGDKEYLDSTVDGNGNEIKIYIRKNFVIKSINQLIRDEGISEEAVYLKYANRIFQTAMPQSSIRPRVMEKVFSLGVTNDFYSIEYVPKSGKNKGVVYEQFYKGENFRLLAWLGDVSEERNGILYKKEMQGTYWDFASETKNLTKEGDVPLPNGKKPLALLKRIIELDSDNDSIYLDFFAGSGTTGHAVFDFNFENKTNHRFLLVQLPEPIDKNDKAQKSSAEFCELIGKKPRISELTKERLRRSSNKLKSDLLGGTCDLGFKVFKLDSSNLKPWDADFDSLAQDLAEATEVVKADRKAEDVLFEILLKYGLDLTLPIDTHTIAGKTVYEVGAGALIVCLDDGVTEAVAEAIGKLKEQLEPEVMRVVFKDSCFASDAAKVNAVQVLKQYGIVDVKSI